MYHGPESLSRLLHVGYEKGVAEVKAGTAWCKSPAFKLSARNSENPNLGSLDRRSESGRKFYYVKDEEEMESPEEDCKVSSFSLLRCPDAAIRKCTRVDKHGAAMSDGRYWHLMDVLYVCCDASAGSCVSETETSDAEGICSVAYLRVHG